LPRETFIEEAVTPIARETAWRALDQPSTWEGITGVDRVHDPEFDADNRLRGFSFETRIGGSPYPGKASPRERVEGRIMAWDISSAHIKGWISVELTDTGEETTVRVTIEVESIGFLATMMFPTISGAIKRGMAETVESFAASLNP
jgi:carbon monoxide dehydrogenase subunit G